MSLRSWAFQYYNETMLSKCFPRRRKGSKCVFPLTPEACDNMVYLFWFGSDSQRHDPDRWPRLACGLTTAALISGPGPAPSRFWEGAPKRATRARTRSAADSNHPWADPGKPRQMTLWPGWGRPGRCLPPDGPGPEQKSVQKNLQKNVQKNAQKNVQNYSTGEPHM